MHTRTSTLPLSFGSSLDYYIIFLVTPLLVSLTRMGNETEFYTLEPDQRVRIIET